MHHVEEGPASQSYGLAVAQLAGVPARVIREARRHLAELEEQSVSAQQPDLFAPARAPAAPEPHPVTAALADVDVDALTPREALALLYELKAQLD